MELVSCAPWNFSWIIEGELCACARPSTVANVIYLMQQGVRHLVTLSEDMMPAALPKSLSRRMSYHTIPVEEFEPPSMNDIDEFIRICDKARCNKDMVCVHCRMGRGRTGVMLACYLVKFYNQTPDMATLNVRLMRSGSVETREQERAVKDYWDHVS